MSLPNPGMDFTAFDVLTAANMDKIVANIEALAAGTGLNANVINSSKIDWAAATGKIWWEELGRTTLSVVGDTVSVTGLAAKKHLLIRALGLQSGIITSIIRFNNDSGNNYSERSSSNNGADASAVSQSAVNITPGGGGENQFATLEVLNIVGAAKPMIIKGVYFPNAAGTAPSTRDTYGKWANTSDQITRVDLINTGGGDFAVGSQVIVLGHD